MSRSSPSAGIAARGAGKSGREASTGRNGLGGVPKSPRTADHVCTVCMTGVGDCVAESVGTSLGRHRSCQIPEEFCWANADPSGDVGSLCLQDTLFGDPPLNLAIGEATLPFLCCINDDEGQ